MVLFCGLEGDPVVFVYTDITVESVKVDLSKHLTLSLNQKHDISLLFFFAYSTSLTAVFYSFRAVVRLSSTNRLYTLIMLLFVGASTGDSVSLVLEAKPQVAWQYPPD